MGEARAALDWLLCLSIRGASRAARRCVCLRLGSAEERGAPGGEEQRVTE